MRRVYVAGPYTQGDPEENTAAAIAAGHRAMDLGLAPFVPHLSHYSHRLRPRPYEDWMALDLAFVEVCDILWRLPGDSPGADREVAHARSRGIPVVSSFDALAGWLATELRCEAVKWHTELVTQRLEHEGHRLALQARNTELVEERRAQARQLAELGEQLATAQASLEALESAALGVPSEPGYGPVS